MLDPILQKVLFLLFFFVFFSGRDYYTKDNLANDVQDIDGNADRNPVQHIFHCCTSGLGIGQTAASAGFSSVMVEGFFAESNPFWNGSTMCSLICLRKTYPRTTPIATLMMVFICFSLFGFVFECLWNQLLVPI